MCFLFFVLLYSWEIKMEEIQNIYDNKEFFNSYKEMRDGKINANELIEIPTIKSMLPNLKDKKILDLGCGEGEMSRYFVENGAKMVVGVDVSMNMIKEARKKKADNLQFKRLAMEELSTLKGKFDIVFSSLAFHYVENFDKLMRDISDKLKKNGYLLFSQEHPLVTCIVKGKDESKYIERNNKIYYLTSDYNNIGKRYVNWNVEGVVKYHRNFETIIGALRKSNMCVEELVEAKASAEAIEKVEKYKYLNDRPFFLFIKARKEK